MEPLNNREKDTQKTSHEWLNFNYKKIIALVGLMVLLTLPTFFIGLWSHSEKVVQIIQGVTIDLNEVILSVLFAIPITAVFALALYFIPWTKPQETKSARLIVLFIVLYFFGILAEIVLVQLGVYFAKLTPLVVYPFVTLAVLIYTLIIYFLCFLNKLESHHIFWEIVRFALVGIIAAVFDFATFSIVRYVAFADVSINQAVISAVSVTCGFIIGVIINYICSVTMVFKNKTDKDISKKPYGMLLFVVLGAVGLFIGIGLEILFYDWLKIPEAITFILRTLVVLVWNYFSRKIFIFK